jgi:hypothetical protein
MYQLEELVDKSFQNCQVFQPSFLELIPNPERNRLKLQNT